VFKIALTPNEPCIDTTKFAGVVDEADRMLLSAVQPGSLRPLPARTAHIRTSLDQQSVLPPTPSGRRDASRVRRTQSRRSALPPSSRNCVPTFLRSFAGTNAAAAAYREYVKNRETSMRIAMIILAGTAALTIIGSAALAQQALTGTVTKIDRTNGTIAIQQTQGGTVGANSGSAAEEFKVQDGLSLNDWHAGDRVTYSATQTAGVKTITKLQKQ
jgi:Cu/Ag efflux protein CusF